MRSLKYRVLFRGETQPGVAADQLKQGMAQLFKLDSKQAAHQTTLTKLFCGRNVVIKDQLSEAEARGYQQAIAQIGGCCEIEVSPESEERKDQRRKIGDRRAVRRTSAILPDRRKNKGRRESDQPKE